VDYFVGLLHTDARRLLGVAAHLAVIAFAAGVMLGGGFILVTRTLAGGQVSPALGLQVGYVYLAVPISGLFIILFAAESILEILANKGIQTPSAPPEELLD
jgi:TRAP-type C4-dicarboxylate transport system permease small subunit